MRSILALVTLGGAYLACLVGVRAVRRRPVALAAPLALALLVCLEAVVLRALSAARAVSAGPVTAAQLLLILGGAALAWRSPGARLHSPRLVRRAAWAWVPLGVLFAMAALSALAYRPNNWDSMTYHLARVAHWIQQRSVEGYPTSIWRQNLLTPGAEYLLLVLQVLSGTDRLAGLVQLGSWVVVVAAVVPLARAFGAGRGVARAGAVIVGAAPMAVLQASSTQNDLVSAATVAALAAASLPLLHGRRRWRAIDLLMLLTAVAAGVLVKIPGLLFVAPLLAVAGARWARCLGERRGIRDAGPAVLLALVLAVPLASVATAGAPGTAPYVYAGFAEPGDRLLNSVRGLLRNLPVSERAGDLVAPAVTQGCPSAGRLCLAGNRQPDEDAAANPALAVLALAALGSAAARWRRLRPAARLGAMALLLGWGLFHALLRDNVWITRLQLPAAVMVALTLGALPTPRGLTRWGAAALVVAAVVQGAWTARRDLRRPISLAALRGGGEPSAYYRGGPPGVGPVHDAALAALARSGCTRLGLVLGGDSYDYPLTWRAMERGVAVRHVTAPDDWPCAVFTDSGSPPPRPDGRRWEPGLAAGLLVPVR